MNTPTQTSFAELEYASKKRQTRREKFLSEMEQVVPWSLLLAKLEPHYPKETLNKSILDFSAAGLRKCDFLKPHKINRLLRSILVVHPCTP